MSKFDLLIAKVITKSRKKISDIFYMFVGSITTTYSKSPYSFNSIDVSDWNESLDDQFLKNLIDHKYLLLSDSYLSFTFSPNQFQFVNKSNRKHSSRIQKKITSGYNHHNWQTDPKSNYFWDKSSWHSNIRIPINRGVDIKIPWELGRLQHLPLLSMEYCKNFDPVLLHEISNQLLDFCANNPPCYGVNWVCTMDVSIRAVSLCLTLDLLKDHIRSDIRDEIVNFIYSHLLYIIRNPEWYVELTNNHYLSNVCGAIVILCHFESNAKCLDLIYEYFDKLALECEKQFYEDGGNFESSATYHKLSTDMILHTVGIMYASNRIHDFSPRKKEHLNRRISNILSVLERAVYFSSCIQDSKGIVPLYGDNDSGFFIKIITKENPEPAYYNYLSNQKVLLLLIGDVEPHVDYYDKKAFQIHRKLFKSYGLLNKFKIPEESEIPKLNNSNTKLGKTTDSYKFNNLYEFNFPIRVETLRSYFFIDSGVYVIKNEDVYISMYNLPVGQNGFGGHKHNDALSVVIKFKDTVFVDDPGTLLYTSDLSLRNDYRSVNAHFCPRFSDVEYSEQNEFIQPFRLTKGSNVTMKYIGNNRLAGSIDIKGRFIHRTLTITESGVSVTDMSNWPIERLTNSHLYIAPAYGVLGVKYAFEV